MTFLFAFIWFVSGCAGTRVLNTTHENYVWPLPPERARIKYLTSLHSEMDLGKRKSLARKISESLFGRTPLRALKKPYAVHARRGKIYVVDTGWKKVLVFDLSARELHFLGQKGRGMLVNPLGVTTDDEERIYVTDAGGCRVLIYDSAGRLLTAFGGEHQLVRPSGIAVNESLGIIYVVDTWDHQVKAFNRRGKLLFTIGKKGKKKEDWDKYDHRWNRGSGDGEFRFPTHIAIGPDGRLYVVDTLNFRVQIFDAQGNFFTKFGKVGDTPGCFYRPKGIGLDSEGHIYVADAAFNNVQIFDQNGKLLLFFGSFGYGKADLRLPAGLFVDSRDNIFVVDQYNHRIQVYKYLGSQPEEKIIAKKKGGE